MSLDLNYNSNVALAGIVAVIQKVSSAGLGEAWSETLNQWIAKPLTGTAYADRTHSVTESPEGSGVGYSSVIAFDNDYTGAAFIGYYDTTKLDPASGTYDATVKPLWSEKRYFRRGEEFDFVVAIDRLNVDIPRALTFQVSKRKDGTYAAKEHITISTKDDFNFGFNLNVFVPSNVSVARIQEIEVSPTGSLVVSEVGGKDAIPVLSIDGGQIAGNEYTVSCIAIMSSGDQYECEGVFDCVS